MRNEFQTDNTIIAYIDGKAIVEDELGELYYCEMPEDFVTIGETMFEEDLTPISELSIMEQYNIRSQLAEAF